MYARGGPVMDKDLSQLYSLVDEVFGFVRGPGQSMELNSCEIEVTKELKTVVSLGLFRWRFS
jgi:hypothetical protein